MMFYYRRSPEPCYIVRYYDRDKDLFHGVKFYKWYNVIQALIRLREISK